VTARAGKALDLTSVATVHAVARRAGLWQSKGLGQHFLVDREVLDFIVAALAPHPGTDVLEVGCGIGTLTGELAARAARVVALDVDPACVAATRMTQRERANVEVVQADARRVAPRLLGLTASWIAAGNLPYRLTGAILSALFERADAPARGVFLVQREVAARLTAEAGGWSLATVALRSLASIERLRDVPPHAFEPPPAVHSSVIRMRPLAQLDLRARAAVIRLARPVFQQRRKTLRHGVANALRGDDVAALRALADASIDSGRRPGTLSLDEWDRLARAVSRLSAAPG
jgi:16S rRNA (adenine1518-N6/adenine1519-N6)-dimethyltransferase